MKNFKKVISVVMALAMIISSFTAVSAAKFADVADTAAYTEAVEVLSALGAVNGVEQENGTFNFEPEKSVTRAEAVTMIVGALNLADDAKAAAGTSQFGDVNTQAAWAAGFVNVGVAQGFIAGYDASTFGPLDNVTYAQLCVMLTQITGYGEYAKAYGGWPTGYTTMAASAGINAGVAVAQDAALTKGQVAMMIWNALQAPMLGVETYAINGNEYKPLDGTDGKFKTLLSEKFDGYVATIKVTGTAANGDVDNDEVEIELVKADWCPDAKSKYPATGFTGFTSGAVELAEGVDVSNSLLQQGKAVYLLDEDDEIVLIYFKASGKTAAKELAADTYYLQGDLNEDKQYAETSKIRFGSTYYKFEDTITVYVNGRAMGTVADLATASSKTETDMLDWILGNAKGTIKLVKDATEENEDPDYNTIFVDFYQIAEVVSVDVDDDVTTIVLRDNRCVLFDDVAEEIVINADQVEEGDTVVTVTRNGEAATLASLVNGDIIAYATDFGEITEGGELVDPAFINIIATDDTVSGSITAIDENDDDTTNDNVYTIGGVNYLLVPEQGADADVDDLQLKASLDLTLDPFGRIFGMETNGTAAKYAIALKVNINDDDSLKLLLDDGSTKTYDVDYSKVRGNDAEFDKEAFIEAINDEETGVNARTVKFEVSGKTGEIIALEVVTGSGIDAEYKTRTGLLGSGNKVLSTTPIICVAEDVEDYRDATEYSVFTKDDLIDGTEYTGFAHAVNRTTLGLVVITSVGTAFGEDSRFAVAISKPADILTEEGDKVKSVKVLYEGEVQDLIFTNAAAATITEEKVEAGLVFFFKTDSDGYVDEVYEAPFATSLADKIDDMDWSFNIWDENAPIQIATGVVVDVKSSYISFAAYDLFFDEDDNAIADAEFDMNLDLDDEVNKEEGATINGIVTYAYADDCVAYTLDGDLDAKKLADNFDVTSVSSIKASNFASFDGGNDELKDDIYKGALGNKAVVATAMIVDGEIVAIFAIEK